MPVTGGAAQRLRVLLLAILAASSRGISRESIAALLWGERDEQRARHSLEQALHGLKRALGEDPIERTSTALALDQSCIQSDVAQFDRAVAAQDWETVTRLYNGAFLEGINLDDAPEFERWSERERSRRRDDYHRALEHAARAAEKQAPDEAVRLWRRLYQENPHSAHIALALAEALAAAGDRDEASRVVEGHKASAPGRRTESSAAPELDQFLQRLHGGGAHVAEKEDAPPDALSTELSRALGTGYRLESRVLRSRLYVSFRARAVQTGKVVIVKVLEPSIARFGDRALLVSQLERAVRLKHDHLATAHTCGTTPHIVYLIGPDDEAETLRDRIERRGELAVADALTMLRQIADGLVYAHTAGVLHLDITPKRIVLTPRGAVLRDIGVASAIMAAGASRGDAVGETNVLLGTAAFMSPELSHGRGKPNEQSDLFSLAAVFFHALTGALPFGPAGAGAQPRASAPSSRVVRSTIPASADAALMRAMAPVRSDRQPNIASFLEDLAAS